MTGFRTGALRLAEHGRRGVIGATVLLDLASGGIAYAHHGFDGRYDLTAPVWVEGTVVEAYFGNPHSELTIRVPDDIAVPSARPDLGPAGRFLDAWSLVIPDDIRGRTVVLELPPTPQYSTLDGRVSDGDTVSAVAVRNCGPPYQLNVQRLRLSDGDVESRAASMSYMVEGC